MTAFEEQRLSEYIDGELPEHEAEQMKRRLETNDALRKQYEGLLALDHLAREAFPQQQFATPSVPAPEKRRNRTWMAAASIAAALAIVAGAGWAAVSYFSGPQVLFSETPAEVAREDAPITEESQPEPAADDVREVSDPVSEAAPELAADVIRGTVVDIEDNAITGARIYWNTRHYPPLMQVRSGAGGEFEVPWPEVLPATVEIHARGYFPASFHLYAPIEGAAVETRVTLFTDYGETFNGRVVDPSGRPLAGVRVTHERAGSFLQSELPATTTGDDGQFTLAMASPYGFGTGQIALTHPEYVTEKLWGRPEMGEISMSPGGNLRVRVLRRGVGVPGAAVTVKGQGFSATSHTDGLGNVLFERLPAPGQYSVVARTEDGALSGISEDDTRVRLGETSECAVTLPEWLPGTLRGQVRMADNRPVPEGVLMSIRHTWTPELEQEVPVGADGHFETGLAEGLHTVTIRKLPAGFAIEEPRTREVVVTRAGQNLWEEFLLTAQERPSTHVHLTNAFDDPVTRALMITGPVERPSGSQVEVWIAADDGTFELPAGYHPVRAYDPATNALGAHTTFTSESVIVQMTEPAGAVAGVVVDDDGAPLPGMMVHAQELRQRGEDPWVSYVVTQTDSLGRFRFHPLAAVYRYGVVPNHAGYDRPNRSVQAAVDPETVTVRMRRSDATLAGIVVDTTGVPVPNAWVWLIDDQSGGPYKSGHDGRFAIHVPPGDYRLQVAIAAMSSDVYAVTAPSEDLVLHLPISLAVAEGRAPHGPEHEALSNNLKQLGLSFKMFANESRGKKFPALALEFGRFHPRLESMYPEYVVDPSLVGLMRGDFPSKLVYLGHTITSEETAMAWLDYYEEYGPEAISGQDIDVPEGMGTGGLDRIYQLREGIERFLITDINDPMSSAHRQSEIPIMWELPGTRDETGGWVLYMDGHTEFIEYPGRFPMTEAFVERMQAIMEH